MFVPIGWCLVAPQGPTFAPVPSEHLQIRAALGAFNPRHKFTPRDLQDNLRKLLLELTRFGGRVTAWVSSRLLHRRSGCRGDAFVGHRGLLPQG